MFAVKDIMGNNVNKNYVNWQSNSNPPQIHTCTTLPKARLSC